MESYLSDQQWNYEYFQRWYTLWNSSFVTFFRQSYPSSAWTQFKNCWNEKFPDDQMYDDQFDSRMREVMKDRLLILRGHDYEGYIFSPRKKGIFGVEDLL